MEFIIGLTYDLKSDYLQMGYSEEETAEFDREDTIVAIEKALRGLGHTTDRIGNAKRLTERLVRGERWDLVFNIAEGLHGLAREAQVPAILDLYEIPYTFSDPVVMGLTLDKGLTKRILKDYGCPTPVFKVIHRPEEAAEITFPPPFFVKPVAEGTGKGITPRSIARDREALQDVCRELLSGYRQPVLVESFLSGREFTVGILGTGDEAEAIGTLEVIFLETAEEDVYSYQNKKNFEACVQYRLGRGEDDPPVETAEQISLLAWRALGCRDGGRVDLRCDESGNPFFLEVNPLAGLNPRDSDLPILCGLAGLPYDQLIERIVLSAAERIVPRPVRKTSRIMRTR